MRFTSKVKIRLWNLRNNNHIRSIYFRLPISLRIKIRRNFVNSYVEPNIDWNPSFDFSKISDIKVTNEEIKRSIENSDADWSSTQPQTSKASYLLLDEVSDGTTTLTFDIWDTVVGRYIPAEGVKKGTSLFISLRDWQMRDFTGKAISVDEIYMKRNEIEESQVQDQGEANFWRTLQLLKEKFSLSVNLSDVFDFEIKNEILNTYPVTVTTDIFQRTGIEKYFISDFHMSNNELWHILKNNQIETSSEKVHSSADNLQSKRNDGELFKKLGLDQINNWTHVGDNPYSDWKNASKYGAKIIRVEKISSNAWHSHEVNDKKLATDISTHLGKTDADRFIIDIASLSFGLCTAAMERAWALGLNKVVYISREGETLKKAHDVINQNRFFDNLPKIEAFHFPVSRSAIVMASWAGLEEEGLNEIALQYPIMGTDALIETLGLPNSMHDLIYRNFGKFEKIRTKDAWDKLDLLAKNEITEYLLCQQRFIHEYIVTNGINPFQAIVCDLGWRGSIQDAMSRILRNNYEGIYLGLFHPYSDKNTGNKIGLMFDEPNGVPAPEYLKLLGPIERAFTISNRQVSGYSMGSNGIEIQFHPISESQNPMRIHLVHEKFEQFLNQVSSSLLSIGRFGVNSKSFLDSVLLNWMQNPNSIHASAWFDELHREGYGAGSSVHYDNTKPDEKWLAKSLRMCIRQGAQNSLWIEGYLEWKPVKILIQNEMINE